MSEKKEIFEQKTMERKAPSKDEFAIKYAQAILKAADIHEESYDHDTANRATEEDEKDQEATGREYCLVDYSKFYTKDMRQSCIEAAKLCGLSEEFGEVLDLSLAGYWNDIIWWAEEVLGIEPKEKKDEE